MEHTLRVSINYPNIPKVLVLILVLVEHTLRDSKIHSFQGIAKVLILVLVEHTLRVAIAYIRELREDSLNPCFSGTYSQSVAKAAEVANKVVLILVLVEHTLRAR